MDIEIEIISTQEYISKYKKSPNKITTKSSTYVRLTEEQKAQRREDRAYHRNWKGSIKLSRAKSQRIADLNNRYFNK
jgi:hypothetical protein